MKAAMSIKFAKTLGFFSEKFHISRALPCDHEITDKLSLAHIHAWIYTEDCACRAGYPGVWPPGKAQHATTSVAPYRANSAQMIGYKSPRPTHYAPGCVRFSSYYQTFFSNFRSLLRILLNTFLSSTKINPI